MENPNVVKTALGIGVLGTAAIALGYMYFNEDEKDTNGMNHQENVLDKPDSPLSIDENIITSDVKKVFEEKTSEMKSFWANTYKSFTESEPSMEDENEIISN